MSRILIVHPSFNSFRSMKGSYFSLSVRISSTFRLFKSVYTFPRYSFDCPLLIKLNRFFFAFIAFSYM